MKKIYLLLLFLLFIDYAYANSCNDCFINKNGVNISKSQYEKLREIGYDYDNINEMSQEAYDSFGIIDKVDQKKKEKFFRETEITNRFGKYYIIEEISEKDFNLEVPIDETMIIGRNVGSLLVSSTTDSYETTYKKLTVTITKTSTSNPKKRNVMSSLVWKIMPSTRSFDIFASRIVNGVIVANSQSGSMTHSWRHIDPITCGYTNTTSQTQSIPTNASAWNKTTSGLGYSGIGYTAKLSTETEVQFCDYLWVYSPVTGYSSSLGYNATANNNSITAYVTYQHATTDVSFNSVYNSYTFSNSGLGNVVYFSNGTLMSSYDGMAGISLTY